MTLARNLSRTLAASVGSGGGSSSFADALLDSEVNGVAWDFRDGSVRVKDTVTPANDFDGGVNSWFTYTAPSTKWIRNAVGVLASGTTLRTEYDASGTALGVRVEPAATNLELRSEDLTHAFFTVQRASVSANAISAPDGTMTADKLVEDTSAAMSHRYYSTVSITAGSVCTVSRWLKAGERSKAQIRVTSNGEVNYVAVSFDLAAGTKAAPVTNGTATYIDSSIEAWLNGWYRCSVTATVDPAATSMAPITFMEVVAGSINYNGDGASGLYVWGAQTEVGYWASSYIPTTSATVTRAADVISKLITAFPYSTATGTLMSEYSDALALTTLPNNYFGAVFSDGTSSNYIGQYRYQAGRRAAIVTGGVLQADLASGSIISSGFQMVRAAVAFAANDAIACHNGTLTASDTSVTLPTVTKIELSRASGSQNGGHMRRGIYVPRRVSNGDLPTFGGTA